MRASEFYTILRVVRDAVLLLVTLKMRRFKRVGREIHAGKSGCHCIEMISCLL